MSIFMGQIGSNGHLALDLASDPPDMDDEPRCTEYGVPTFGITVLSLASLPA